MTLTIGCILNAELDKALKLTSSAFERTVITKKAAFQIQKSSCG